MKYGLGILVLLMAFFAHADDHEVTKLSRNVEATKAAYAAFAEGDMEAWKAVHNTDVEWTILEGLPYAGTYVGTEAIIENVFAKIGLLWPDFKVEPLEYYESGDKVFVHVRITIDGKQTEALHMATMRDGKQAAFTPFENSAFMMDRVK